MAAVVNNVPNPEFVIRDLATSSGSIVSRRRVKMPCNAPGTYGHNGQTARPYVLTFDLWDGESFLDLRSLRFNATFTPSFYRWVNSLASVAAGSPGTSDKAYAAGTGPNIDHNAGALIARLRIGNSQGFIIEDVSQYGIFANIMHTIGQDMSATNSNSPDQSSAHNSGWNEKQLGMTPFDNHLHNNQSYLTEQSCSFTYSGTNVAIATATVNKTPDKDLQIAFSGSSFLNCTRYLPLFALRNGLRVEIELENPLLAFYHQYGGGKPEFLCATNSAVWTSISSGVFTPVATLPNAENADGTQGALAHSDTIPQWSKIAAGDLLLGYKNGVLVAWGLVSAVSVSGAQGTASFTSAGFDAMIPSLTASTLSDYVDQLWFVTGSRAAAFIAGKNAGGEYASTIAPAYLSAAGAGNTIVQGASTGATVGGIYWNYALTNNELLLDYVKPSSEVLAEYMNRFNSPMGLPYAFTRSLYFSKTVAGNASGTQQISIPVAVRSLKGLLVVITDPLSISAGSDATIYNFPSKSSFMMRGLTDAQLQIGGQQFPAYKMKFDNNNPLQHIPETLALFNAKEYNCDIYPRQGYKFARNYQACSGNVLPMTTVKTVANSSTFLQGTSATGYHDTSSFILGISTMRRDGDFASGVDCSQAGSVTLNLTFASTAPGQGVTIHRDRVLHIYALADAVVTFQKDANGVRY